jgi:hypothetical protein
MAALYMLGFTPFQNAYLPSGSHNLLPVQIRKYLPKPFDYSLNTFFSSHLFCFNIPYFPITIKPTPNQIFNTSRNKIYKILTSHKNINDLENMNISELEKEVIFNGFNSLQLAASTNCVEALDYLIKRKKLDINSKFGKYEKTALHIAIEYGNLLSIKYLLANGANPNELDYYGFDAYDKAEFRGNYTFRDLVNKLNLFKKNKLENNKSQINKLHDKNNIYITSYDKSDWYTSSMTKPSSLIKLHFVENITDSDYIDIRNFQLYFLKDTTI